MPKTTNTIPFEKAYAELEKIVEELEGGDLSIDESVKKFEKGLALAQALKEQLHAVEQKVETIKKTFAKDGPEDS